VVLQTISGGELPHQGAVGVERVKVVVRRADVNLVAQKRSRSRYSGTVYRIKSSFRGGGLTSTPSSLNLSIFSAEYPCWPSILRCLSFSAFAARALTKFGNPRGRQKAARFCPPRLARNRRALSRERKPMLWPSSHKRIRAKTGTRPG